METLLLERIKNLKKKFNEFIDDFHEEEIDIIFFKYMVDSNLDFIDYSKLCDYFNYNDKLKLYIYKKVDELIVDGYDQIYYFRLLNSLSSNFSYNEFQKECFA